VTRRERSRQDGAHGEPRDRVKHLTDPVGWSRRNPPSHSPGPTLSPAESRSFQSQTHDAQWAHIWNTVGHSALARSCQLDALGMPSPRESEV
jgi:hypothetical protein